MVPHWVVLRVHDDELWRLKDVLLVASTAAKGALHSRTQKAALLFFNIQWQNFSVTD